MYAYYLQHGHTLKELCNLSELEKSFYIASMLIMKKQKTDNNIALAEYTGKLANPYAIKK
ncbi:hypothetical protein FDE76_15395 [Clostridium botulinum]|uniref:Uncharacterized protein n=1 Tax=Clostridium botulinum (strain Eklund 17B / Type B) TaxID=935198 RepID=B2TMV1_CLOBB|nr:conserved hypothetical protein [Clostridium botulinum B str. Eklund 17B (NRP)]MBY6977137.1 hypothetical protein [Clostridium botulinum]MBY6999295.1 hypothetical protein [Clostridium botulinum]MCR1272623.1 hypothetical protein [Clostridium botulinum]NFD70001.1 hypothetical protein [Clostridium botulinum]